MSFGTEGADAELTGSRNFGDCAPQQGGRRARTFLLAD